MTDILKVRDVMMSNFTKVDGVMKVSDVLNMMRDKNINAILVEPRDENDVYGIMTLKDIARKVIGENRKLHEAHIYEIMSKPVLSVKSDMPVPYAARFLTNFNVSYAMVIESNDVIGMVSLNGMVNRWKD
ncbi:MAG: CBS domain-containing protein [Nitrospina sp.]|jgi:signal-transduction protein with cAMP-binding, CBS, and nucleotidyltransferase domain|nr:CBS domain-containing protein [Nitrospina sp.]MBT3875918.1 CBS domain-containing protein [Nitrospina sp.]MBT4046947.1 CBS domain-containing protein [Nitrospina sp.]MBT4557333.1 CBS domain-containing protein [Nitrospina sp.]MBT5347605.1 CBS domain-containing protein [Nitrospina sp.]